MTSSQADSVSFASVTLLSFLNIFFQVMNSSLADSGATSKFGATSDMWSQESEMIEYQLKVQQQNLRKQAVKDEEKEEELRQQRLPFLILQGLVDPNKEEEICLDKDSPP